MALSADPHKENMMLPTRGLLLLLIPFGWMVCKLPDLIFTLTRLWSAGLHWIGWLIIILALAGLLLWYTLAGVIFFLSYQQPAPVMKIFAYSLFFLPLAGLYLLRFISVSATARFLADFALDILFFSLPFAIIFGILWFLRFHMRNAPTGQKAIGTG